MWYRTLGMHGRERGLCQGCSKGPKRQNTLWLVHRAL